MSSPPSGRPYVAGSNENMLLRNNSWAATKRWATEGGGRANICSPPFPRPLSSIVLQILPLSGVSILFKGHLNTHTFLTVNEFDIGINPNPPRPLLGNIKSMTLVVAKLNEHNCRGVIATNFTHSFCGSSLVKSLGLNVRDLANSPAAATSDGTPIEFLGETMVLLELGPWQSDGLIPLLVAWDCPADILIGEDLIKEIGKKFPVKFEFYKNAVNIGGTRVSMLDPMAAEEKFISVVVMDPHSNKEVGMETWKKGNKEAFEPGGLVKRRVEVIGGKEDDAGQHGGEGGQKEDEEEEEEEEDGQQQRRENKTDSPMMEEEIVVVEMTDGNDGKEEEDEVNCGRGNGVEEEERKKGGEILMTATESEEEGRKCVKKEEEEEKEEETIEI